VLEAVQRRLDEDPQAMRRRREMVEHPFGTIKARMGATHFLMETLPRVAAEMALHVLAYNLTRVINMIGPGRLIAAIRTWAAELRLFARCNESGICGASPEAPYRHSHPTVFTRPRPIAVARVGGGFGR
jgi:hypothetical protein